MIATTPSRPPRILFLTRRYPPSIGGIETHCHELFVRLRHLAPTRLVALGRSSLLHLGWFLPWCLLLTAWLLLWRRVDVVYFSDGVVAALAPALRCLFRRPRFVTTVYGLELRYRNRFARRLMVAGARSCDRVAVISRNTCEIAASQGIPAERLRVVYLGVEPLEPEDQTAAGLRRRFEQKHGLQFGKQRILLNFGRQVARKGVAAFLEHGLPLLEPDIHLLIGGAGPQMPRIRALAEAPGVRHRVHLLGPPPDDELAMLRACADLFIMPNVALADDVEGFGQAQLECMHAGTPAVVFAVDALPESVRQGGYLIAPGDYRAFVDQIHAFFRLSPAQRRAKEEEARTYVRREYSWDTTAAEYLRIFAGQE